jgi:ADP-ribose pyrophosphatase YjhB (NUDIX family)
MEPQWLTWVKTLQAIAQTGLTYAKDPYDVERYELVRLVSAEMMAAGSGVESTDLFVNLFKLDVGYATPKVDVRAAVFREGRLLLVREKEDGRWALPGGWADIGDSPSAAVVREVKEEESGYDVKTRKLLALLDRTLHGHPPIPYHAYKLFFLCDLLWGKRPSRSRNGCCRFLRQRRYTTGVSDPCNPRSNSAAFRVLLSSRMADTIRLTVAMVG